MIWYEDLYVGYNLLDKKIYYIRNKRLTTNASISEIFSIII